MVQRATNLVLTSLAVVIGIAIVVYPFVNTLSGDQKIHGIALGSGLAVGFGAAIKLRFSKRAAPMGIINGAIIGLCSALVTYAAYSIGARGLGFIIPPSVGVSIALVDAVGDSRMRGFKSSMMTSLLVGVILGLGLIPELGVGALAPVAMSLYVGAYVAWRSPKEEAEKRFTPGRLILAVILIALFMLTWLTIRAEFRAMGYRPDHALAWMLFLMTEYTLISAFVMTSVTLIIVPIAAFLITRLIAGWMRPRLEVYEQILDYLRVMWVPIGSFAVGYAAIILVFAGFYGSIYRMQGTQAFEFPEGTVGVIEVSESIDAEEQRRDETADETESNEPEPVESRKIVVHPSLVDWLFFSFFNSTAQDYNRIQPVSHFARLVVGLQLLFSVAWAVVIFAAVMTHIQPKLQRIADELEQRGL